MTDVDDLDVRNTAFATDGFDAGLTINPRGNMMVVGCVDPRVDPGHVLGLDNGEAGSCTTSRRGPHRGRGSAHPARVVTSARLVALSATKQAEIAAVADVMARGSAAV